MHTSFVLFLFTCWLVALGWFVAFDCGWCLGFCFVCLLLFEHLGVKWLFGCCVFGCCVFVGYYCGFLFGFVLCLLEMFVCLISSVLGCLDYLTVACLFCCLAFFCFVCCLVSIWWVFVFADWLRILRCFVDRLFLWLVGLGCVGLFTCLVGYFELRLLWYLIICLWWLLLCWFV